MKNPSLRRVKQCRQEYIEMYSAIVITYTYTMSNYYMLFHYADKIPTPAVARLPIVEPVLAVQIVV